LPGCPLVSITRSGMLERIRTNWRKVSTGMLLVSVLGAGAIEVRRAAAADDCCTPGAPCCHPGAPCCAKLGKH
jgi:hypothetical protein